MECLSFFFWIVWVSGRSVTIVIVLRILFHFISFRRCVSSFLYVLLGLVFGGCDFVKFDAADNFSIVEKHSGEVKKSI